MRPNNFDLVRLLAALQVVYCHTTFHLGITAGVGHPVFSNVINWFPGVPIFFTVSGFLISRSWESTYRWTTYAQNRLLRIYPGLWAAFVASIVLATTFGFITPKVVASGSFVGWVAAQLTFVQVYNPEFLRGFGLGAINGSLWTIPVELGFYVTLPLLYAAILNRTSRLNGDMMLGGLALISFSYWFQLSHLAGTDNPLIKLQMVTPLPHLYMFLFGILVQRNFEALRPYLEGRFVWWLGVHAIHCLILDPSALESQPTKALIQLIGRVLLGLTTVSAAFTCRSLSERLLRGNDLSYGVYLYHVLVINTIYHLGYRSGQIHLAITVVVSVALAALSWRFVESPALSLKSSTRSKPSQQEAATECENFQPTRRAA